MKRFALTALLLGCSLNARGEDGEAIWKGTCQVCHAEPLSGAPLITSKAAWAPRLKKGKEALYQSALKGFTGPKGTEMPARGGNSSLTDAQVRAAVDYMTTTVSK